MSLWAARLEDMVFSKEPNLKREPKLSDQVTEFLLNEINLGTLKPGESLPSEAELSYRFNVSRTVIREALARLKSEGKVESRRGSRSRVSTGFNRSLQIRIKDGSDYVELYEIKALMEADISMLAAMYRTREDVDALKTCLEAMRSALNSSVDGTSTNLDFHRIISQACNNSLLAELLRLLDELLWDLIQADKQQSSNLPLTPDSLQEHEVIFAAILNQDPDAAREGMLMHLKHSAARRGITVSF